MRDIEMLFATTKLRLTKNGIPDKRYKWNKNIQIISNKEFIKLANKSAKQTADRIIRNSLKDCEKML